MNEQLIVKNFGPIKDATVDFKKVTVFIGPTGGGKSTLAKLAAVFRDISFYSLSEKESFQYFSNYSLKNYFNKNYCLDWKLNNNGILIYNDRLLINERLKEKVDKASENTNEDTFRQFMNYVIHIKETKGINVGNSNEERNNFLSSQFDKFFRLNILSNIYRSEISPNTPNYIPSERAFVSAIEYSWAGLIRDDIGLPKALLDFANSFSVSRKDISELYIPFFDVTYQHVNGRDFIKIPEREEPLMLLETASGIQSVTPMLVLLEQLSRQKEQAQSFIIEEPELNLYPTAQQGLMNWLVEKCTTGENDLTITTHSPYILSRLNLLLYAYQVAEKHPNRADDVAKIVPRESWINPKEFACYQVENGGVQSLVNEELGLIDDNELDNLSGDAADAFDNLIRLSKSVTVK